MTHNNESLSNSAHPQDRIDDFKNALDEENDDESLISCDHSKFKGAQKLTNNVGKIEEISDNDGSFAGLIMVTESIETDTTSQKNKLKQGGSSNTSEHITSSMCDYLNLSKSLPRNAVDAFFDSTTPVSGSEAV